jgi:hypothetical protein
MNRQEVLRANHSVFVTYVIPQKPLAKTLTFRDEGTMGGRRSETSAQPTRAFSLLIYTVKFSEVRLFLRKSHVGSGCSVYTRSENAVVLRPASRNRICRAKLGRPGQLCSISLFRCLALKPSD